MLTSRQIEQFADDGYLVVEDVLDQQTVLDPVRAEYGAILDQLYEAWWQEGAVDTAPDGLGFEEKIRLAYVQGRDWFQPMDISLPGGRITPDTPMHFGPAVFGMLNTPRLLDLVADLIGPEITSTPIQHVRIKPPAPDIHDNEARAHLTTTDWHQDRGVALEIADQTDMVTVWIAVTDADEENGCLTVVPGGHKTGLIPHCALRQTSIHKDLLPAMPAKPVPVPSGGVLILHPLMPHASLANVSDGIRWSFDVRYNRTGQPTGREHFPEFVARSRAAPETELQDWRAWRQMWEDARTRLSGAPHIDIHRWSGDAPHCA